MCKPGRLFVCQLDVRPVVTQKGFRVKLPLFCYSLHFSLAVMGQGGGEMSPYGSSPKAT